MALIVMLRPNPIFLDRRFTFSLIILAKMQKDMTLTSGVDVDFE